MPTIISKAVGIDLGTTNSAVAIMNPGDTDIIIHQDPVQKRRTIPSCVWKDPKTGEIVVGSKAFRRIGTHPTPIRSIKRKMGHTVQVRLTDEDATPDQISGYILAFMKRQIEEDLARLGTADTSWIVDRAIITVPAYFDQPAIDATRKAGELAGLRALELLAEPTAAACYHCWLTNTQNGVFLVYDFGGGTFDVTVLRSNAGTFDVLGISGNSLLGGDDLDAAIARNLQERLVKEGYALDLDVNNNEEDQLRFDILRLLAEGIKKGLTTSGEFLLRDSGMLRDKENNPVIIDSLFERPEVEAIMRPIVERTIPYCFDALEQAHAKAGISLADVNMVILAGGSTHIPLVQEMVRQNLCALDGPAPLVVDQRAGQPRAQSARPLYQDVDTIVALGAAIRAAAQGGLEMYNTERTVRVSFRGIGITGATRTAIGGKVESLVAAQNMEGGRIGLVIAELNYEDEKELGKGGTFGFQNVPLQAGAENMLTFNVYDGSGQIIASVGRQVTQDRAAARPTGGAVGTGVISKAILLEVEGAGGNVYLKKLFPVLTKLPISQTFNFTHPGGVESLIFPLFQHSRKIQVIRVPIPRSMPKGTPIVFDIHIDELSFITVKGTVGDVNFDAAVEVPPDRKLPTAEELASLEKSFREATTYLQPGKKAVAEARFEKLKMSYDAAVKQGDETQALHDYEEMEEIVASISKTGGPLQPPRDFFDELVSDCLEINRAVVSVAAEAGQPHDAKEMERAVEVQRQRGEKAIQDGDQKEYSDAITMLENQKNFLIGLYRKWKKTDDKQPTEAEMVNNNIKIAEGEADRIGRFAEAQNRKDLLEDVKQIKRKIADAECEAQRNPHGANEKVAQLRQHLEQMKNILLGRQDKTSDGGHAVDLDSDNITKK